MDLSGLACPHLVLELAAAMRPLAAGTTVTVIATDPLSAVDVPFYLDRHGHRLLSRVREAGRIVFTLACGPGQPLRDG